MPDAFGVNALTSMPIGTRSWEFVDANFTDGIARVLRSLACARIVSAPKLTATTGRATAVVPAAEVAGTGTVPGTASVTGTCASGAKPVSFGFEKTESGVVVTDAFPVGARGLKVVLENMTTAPSSIRIAVRCVLNPSGSLRIDVKPVIVPVDGAPAMGGSPGDAQGTKACKPGQVLLGGGYRTGDDTFTDGFGPVLLRDVPVLGYLFRNFSTTTENSKLLIFCTPRIIRSAE
jgi:Flp pilus assembly secretin CpaC